MKLRKIDLVVFAVTLAFGSASAAAQTTFTFTQLDPPGSISTEADLINSQGQIIGFFFDAAGRQHGWLFQNGAFTQIDFPGASGTRTVNINNSSVITAVLGRRDYIADLLAREIGGFVEPPGYDKHK
ncbi:MAG TPA: hypothetical protein VIJ01_18130 [Candidatus Angelobacter sp.]